MNPRPTEAGGRAVTPSQALANLPSGLFTQHSSCIHPDFTVVLLSSVPLKCVTSLGTDVLGLGDKGLWKWLGG